MDTESDMPDIPEEDIQETQTEEAFEKSPEEVAAEEAMLAELANMDLDETDDDDGDIKQSALSQFQPTVDQQQNLDLLMDVTLQITVELGRREMRFGEVLQLGKGSLVELNKIADEPVDIYVNQSKIAEGEVVVVDDHFGVRITKLLNTGNLRR